MTYEEAKKRLEDWYNGSTVEISPELLDCCYNVLKQTAKDEVVENILDAVFIFNNTTGITELRVPADSIEQRNGWILALWNEKVVGGAKEECLKAFCLEPHA